MLRGLRALAACGLCFSLTVFARQLRMAAEVVAAVQDLTFVLDHIGGPPVETGDDDGEWAAGIAGLGELPNVICKLSGAHSDPVSSAALRPYFEVALEAFGPGRLMTGSDWPVSWLGRRQPGRRRGRGRARRRPHGGSGPGNADGGPSGSGGATGPTRGRRAGEAPDLGTVDPELARALAEAAARNPRSTWCLTITDHAGRPIAHGCARPARTKTKNRDGPGQRDGLGEHEEQREPRGPGELGGPVFSPSPSTPSRSPGATTGGKVPGTTPG